MDSPDTSRRATERSEASAAPILDKPFGTPEGLLSPAICKPDKENIPTQQAAPRGLRRPEQEQFAALLRDIEVLHLRTASARDRNMACAPPRQSALAADKIAFEKMKAHD
jgi:hypothetical protein